MPSIFQVRYCGNGYLCKGVLVVEHNERNENILTFRRSLVKTSTKDGNEVSKADSTLRTKIGIISWSRPRQVGKLNKQAVALLSANIPSHILLRLQQLQLNDALEARSNFLAAARRAALLRQWEILKPVIKSCSKENVPGSFRNS